MYDGIVYRAAWRIGRIGFGLLWMPSKPDPARVPSTSEGEGA